MDLRDPTSSAEDSHARMSAWLAIVRDWLESEADFGTSIYGWSESFGLLGYLSKMSLASYLRTKVKTLRSSSLGLPNAGMVWRGACWTARISESHSDVVACSLSDILEPHAHPKYSLSPKAAAGILRRALKRGRTLPTALEQALVAVAQMTPTDTLPTSPKSPTHSPENQDEPQAPIGVEMTSRLTEYQGRSRQATALAADGIVELSKQTGDLSLTDGVEAIPTGMKETSFSLPLLEAEGQVESPVPEGTTSWSVRRLTLTECERLQGFPDGWTLLPQMGPATPPSATQ